MKTKPTLKIVISKDGDLFRTDVSFNMNDEISTGFHYFGSGNTELESMDSVIREIVKPNIIDIVRNT